MTRVLQFMSGLWLLALGCNTAYKIVGPAIVHGQWFVAGMSAVTAAMCGWGSALCLTWACRLSAGTPEK